VRFPERVTLIILLLNCSGTNCNHVGIYKAGHVCLLDRLPRLACAHPRSHHAEYVLVERLILQQFIFLLLVDVIFEGGFNAMALGLFHQVLVVIRRQLRTLDYFHRIVRFVWLVGSTS